MSNKIRLIAGGISIIAFILAMLLSCSIKPDNRDIKPYYKLNQKVYLKPDSSLVLIRKSWRTEAGPKYEGYYIVNGRIYKTTFFEFEIF
jgi:hypothetical protein